MKAKDQSRVNKPKVIRFYQKNILVPYPFQSIIHNFSRISAVLFISAKCKRFPRHLLFLLWFSWRFKIAEVNGNRAEQGSIYFCKHLHDKLLWPIGGVVCVYTSQLNGTGHVFFARPNVTSVPVFKAFNFISLIFLNLF